MQSCLFWLRASYAVYYVREHAHIYNASGKLHFRRKYPLHCWCGCHEFYGGLRRIHGLNATLPRRFGGLLRNRGILKYFFNGFAGCGKFSSFASALVRRRHHCPTRLKGNQVKGLNRPATVSSVAYAPGRECRATDRYNEVGKAVRETGTSQETCRAI